MTSRLGKGKSITFFYSVVCKHVLTNYFKLYNLIRTDAQNLLILLYNMEKEHFCNMQDMKASVHLSTGQDWPTWLLS
jgi:hypothetical protein